MSNDKVYPELREPMRKDVRFKSVGQEVYLCVKTDTETGKHTIATKTLNMDQWADSELDFSLYYYVTAHAGETKMVLPVHQATNVCFSMTDDKKLQISGLHRDDTTSDITPAEDPMRFTIADERFFYIKSLDNEAFALEATNGIDNNHYLAVDDDNTPNIKEHTDDLFPDNLRFYLEEFRGINFILHPN